MSNPRGNPDLKPRWKPGESGNPAGRPNAGACVQEWLNALVAKGTTERELRRIARCKAEKPARRIAAQRLLQSMEIGDLADMQPYLDGKKTLAQLRRSGVATEVVRKAKVKSLVDKDGETVIEREIELHDRSRDAIGQVMDYTNGRPVQSVSMTHDGSIRTQDEGHAAAVALLASLCEAVGVVSPADGEAQAAAPTVPVTDK